MSGTESSMVDITVVGGGPVGLFAVFYAGLRGCSTRVIDRLPRLGGQCGNIYPGKIIFDVAGIPRISGQDLVQSLSTQMAQFDPDVRLEEEVRDIVPVVEGGPFRIQTDKGEYLSKRVIITLGLGAFMTRRPGGVLGLEGFESRGLEYFVPDMALFDGRRVLVVGGGDSAVDWAMEASTRAREVSLIHRSDVFQAHEGNLARLIHSSVQVLPFHELKALEGDERVEQVVVLDNRSGAEHGLDVDLVVVAIGFLHNLDLVRRWGISVVGNSIPVGSSMQTNIPGIFAAGDIVVHPSKMKLIATGAGEAAIAANAAADGLVPSKRCLYNVAGDRYLGKRLDDVARKYLNRP